jgi:hypothetical protein
VTGASAAKVTFPAEEENFISFAGSGQKKELLLKECREMAFQVKNKLCPFVKNPLHDCYCFDLNSRNINPAIHYCSNYYESCDIFKKEAAHVPHCEKLLRSK